MNKYVRVGAMVGVAIAVGHGAVADIPPFNSEPFPEDPLIYSNGTPGWLDPRVDLRDEGGGVRWWLSDDQAQNIGDSQGWMQRDGFLHTGWIPSLDALEEREYLLTDIHWWGTYGYYTAEGEDDPVFHADATTDGKIPISGHKFHIDLYKTDETVIHLDLLDGVEALWKYAPPAPGPLMGGAPTEVLPREVPVYGYAAHVTGQEILTSELKGISIVLETFGDPDADDSYWYWVTSQYDLQHPENVHEARFGPESGWEIRRDDLAFELTGVIPPPPPVPEPGSLMLMGLGVAALFGRHVRRSSESLHKPYVR